jgi:hypothetical protein
MNKSRWLWSIAIVGFAAILVVLVYSTLAVVSPDAVAAKGGGKPPKCCDPALEPGTGGNPLCFEGHTCCSDGKWRCNNADGSPSCTPGTVCP